ncbi:MAG: hypothetical protein ACE5J4_02285 [Candidatus Aenigmatarchaeota archaeon]
MKKKLCPNFSKGYFRIDLFQLINEDDKVIMIPRKIYLGEK